MKEYFIKQLDSIEAEGALLLAWQVFQEFEAPDYCEEGIEEFKSFVFSASLPKKIQNGQFNIWGCYHADRIIGMIAARPPCHISLLFVDKQYHRRGIARALLREMTKHYSEADSIREITVHSSPYAREVYNRMGFVDTGAEQVENGIRYIPMKLAL